MADRCVQKSHYPWLAISNSFTLKAVPSGETTAILL
jgi:hypothetical protein